MLTLTTTAPEIDTSPLLVARQARSHAEELITKLPASLELHEELAAAARRFDAREAVLSAAEVQQDATGALVDELCAATERAWSAYQACGVQGVLPASLRAECADFCWSVAATLGQAGATEEESRFLERLVSCDDERYADLLEGTATLEVSADLPEAHAWLHPIEGRGHRARAIGAGRDLGPLPVDPQDLAPGDYLLVLRARGFGSARRPFRLRRAEDLRVHVRMFRLREVGADFVYIPAGTFDSGGDAQAPGSAAPRRGFCDNFAVGRFPVTVGEYLLFIDDLAERDPGRALSLTPRYGLGAKSDPRRAVTGLSREAARAYAAWLSQRTGVSYRLPSETEWEKAARGADGRAYVWGDAYRPGICLDRLACQGEAVLEAVGQREGDRSVYGVRDLAGGVCEWTSSDDEDLAVVRGGSFAEGPAEARCARRLLVAASTRSHNLGFRLVRVLPSGGGETLRQPAVPESSSELKVVRHAAWQAPAQREEAEAFVAAARASLIDDRSPERLANLVAESVRLTGAERALWIGEVNTSCEVRACFTAQGEPLPESDQSFDFELVHAAWRQQRAIALGGGDHPVLALPVPRSDDCLLFERRFAPAPFGEEELALVSMMAELIAPLLPEA